MTLATSSLILLSPHLARMCLPAPCHLLFSPQFLTRSKPSQGRGSHGGSRPRSTARVCPVQTGG
jgi:hypothetical protein